jgi:hypothetical protein
VAAMDHADNLYNSLKHYFGMLEQAGYYNQKETMNLVIYLFIVNEVFNGNLSFYLDDEGLNMFNKTLRCLYNGCLINGGVDNITIKDVRPYNLNNFQVRYSENSVTRFTEKSDIRTPEQRTR